MADGPYQSAAKGVMGAIFGGWGIILSLPAACVYAACTTDENKSFGGQMQKVIDPAMNFMEDLGSTHATTIIGVTASVLTHGLVSSDEKKS